MNTLEKSIKHFEGLQKRYTTQHNGKMCQFVACALKAMNESRWIPESERLPSMEECQKNDCRFIVTDGNRRYQDWFNYIDGYFQSYNCNGTEFSLLRRDNLVVAWKPMPEEYKGE